MTSTQHGYAELIENFGRQLREAETSQAGHRRLLARLAAGVAASITCALAAAFLVALSDDGRSSVLAQAAAALAPPGQLVRLVTTSHEEMRGGAQAQIVGSEAELGKPRITERWSTSTPLRWRTLATAPIVTAHGTLTGPVQLSYNNGIERLYVEPLNRLDITTGVPQDSRHALASVDGVLGADPVAAVRSMLQSGALRDAGNGTIEGHLVKRLVGHLPASPLAPGVAQQVEYDVNPTTYAPVRLTVEMPGVPVRENTGTLTFVLDVNKYEQLPLNATTSRLLDIHTTGNPAVEHHRAR